MRTVATLVTVAALMSITGCGSSETTMQLATAPMELMKKCQSDRDVAACDKAIEMFERNIPLLKANCNSGDQMACGLFPGYDSSPQMLRQFKANCIDFEPGSSFEGAARDAAVSGLKAGCAQSGKKAN